jgi:hypothetical protein
MDAEIFRSTSAICALTKFVRAESSGTSIMVYLTSSLMESVSPTESVLVKRGNYKAFCL